MVSKLLKYLFFIGFLHVFEIANTLTVDVQNIEDPIRYNSSGLRPTDVKFLLYTKKNRNIPQAIDINDKELLSKSNYDIRKPTKFMIHGWKDNADGDCVSHVRPGFLKHFTNVIVVEWTRIADFDYQDTARYLRGVAEVVSKMIDFLIKQGTKVSEMTIAGHSFGAHIAGMAAHFSKNTLPHVVALDPAAPGFTKQMKDERVDVSNAGLVETIHTDTQFFGLPKIIGRVDYFPNGGEFQAGCENSNALTADLCAHNRACHYYGESMLKGDKWLARRCDSHESFKNLKCKGNQIARFATYTHKVKRPDGTYYLRTRDKPNREGLYGLGKKGV